MLAGLITVDCSFGFGDLTNVCIATSFKINVSPHLQKTGNIFQMECIIATSRVRMPKGNADMDIVC